MKTIFKIFIIFLAITGAATILINDFGIRFGHIDFWLVHGFLFLLFIAAFPRLTLFFSGVAWGGIIWWIAWLFFPRVLVAVLATFAYWQTNKILVIISWLFAIGGESTEKYVIHHNVRHVKIRKRR